MQNALIVEDTPEVRGWMAEAIAAVYPGIAVVSAENLAQARDNLGLHRYNVALVDLNLPDGSGIDLITELTRSNPETLSVVVTIYDDDQHLFPALQAGAGGYLLKDMPGDQFIRRLRGIADGEPPLSPAIARRLLGHFGRPAREPAQDLTPREREVLALIAKGLKLADVAAMLSISRHTAADHVKNIYRKLNISSRAEATLEATRLGFITPG